MAASPASLRRYLPSPASSRSLDDGFAVRGREFEHLVEHQPATPKATSVEAQGEFIQVAGEMRVGDRPLVGAKRPPLGQRGDSVHHGQQLAWFLSTGPSGELTVRFVTIAEFVQPPVTLPAARNDRRARFNVIQDEAAVVGAVCFVQGFGRLGAALTRPESSWSLQHPQTAPALRQLRNPNFRQDPGLDLRLPFPQQIERAGSALLFRNGTWLFSHGLSYDADGHLDPFAQVAKEPS